MNPSPATCRYCFATIIYDQNGRYYVPAEAPENSRHWYCKSPTGAFKYHESMDPLIQMAYDATKPGI